MWKTESFSMNLVFTVHKLTDERRKLWANLFAQKTVKGLKYLVFQEENTKGGAKHLQGYMEITKNYRYAKLIKLCGGECWFMARAGTRSQAIHYVRKPVKACRCRHCTGDGVYNGGMRFNSENV